MFMSKNGNNNKKFLYITGVFYIMFLSVNLLLERGKIQTGLKYEKTFSKNETFF